MVSSDVKGNVDLVWKDKIINLAAQLIKLKMEKNAIYGQIKKAIKNYNEGLWLNFYSIWQDEQDNVIGEIEKQLTIKTLPKIIHTTPKMLNKKKIGEQDKSLEILLKEMETKNWAVSNIWKEHIVARAKFFIDKGDDKKNILEKINDAFMSHIKIVQERGVWSNLFSEDTAEIEKMKRIQSEIIKEIEKNQTKKEKDDEEWKLIIEERGKRRYERELGNQQAQDEWRKQGDKWGEDEKEAINKIKRKIEQQKQKEESEKRSQELEKKIQEKQEEFKQLQNVRLEKERLEKERLEKELAEEEKARWKRAPEQKKRLKRVFEYRRLKKEKALQ